MTQQSPLYNVLFRFPPGSSQTPCRSSLPHPVSLLPDLLLPLKQDSRLGQRARPRPLWARGVPYVARPLAPLRGHDVRAAPHEGRQSPAFPKVPSAP